MESDQVLREQLIASLRGGNAHMGLDDAVADFPPDQMNQTPPNVAYTPWQLLEHIRIAQWDIVEFILNPGHVSPDWPDGYWPAGDELANIVRWNQTLDGLRADLKRAIDIVSDPNTTLTAEIPHAPGYTVLREILLIADHNAYHMGEFAILRQVMGAWGR